MERIKVSVSLSIMDWAMAWTAIFTVLRLCDVIQWKWWQVTLPLWVVVFLGLLGLITTMIVKGGDNG